MKKYENLSVGQVLISALEEAVDYEKGSLKKGIKSRKI